MRIAFEALEPFIDFKGKKVLEVGGNSNCRSALPFLLAGAELVVVSGLDDVASSTPPPDTDGYSISIVQADARNLLATFAREQFDIVYGVSVIEHIDDLPLALSQIQEVLKQDGLLYLQGNPIWSGPIGHHVWVTPYHNQSEGTYTFMTFPGSESSYPCNPIPDWGHLLMTPVEMGEHLLASGIPPRDVLKLINSIYWQKGLNRSSFADIASAVSNSGLVTLSMKTTESLNFPGILPAAGRVIAGGSEEVAIKELKRQFGAAGNYRATGVEYVLKKGRC